MSIIAIECYIIITALWTLKSKGQLNINLVLN